MSQYYFLMKLEGHFFVATKKGGHTRYIPYIYTSSYTMNSNSIRKLKKVVLGGIFLLMVISCGSVQKSASKEEPAKTARIVGYLAIGNFDQYQKIEYCKLTHLNLSFANPDSLGFIVSKPIKKVVDFARGENPKLKILISVGGGGVSPKIAANWSKLIDIDQNRPKLIKNLLDFVDENNLDGVNVDLEWDQITSGYGGFVTELGQALKAKNKLMTAALPYSKRLPNITDASLQAFDFINIMAYDSTSPWQPDSPGQHSSYQDALDGINFWEHKQGIAGNRLTLGLPFYGYDFTDPKTVGVHYKDIAKLGEPDVDRDNIGLAYYNGRLTISKKVALAAKRVSGVMIWELSQDSFDEYSLLDLIIKKYEQLGFTVPNTCR